MTSLFLFRDESGQGSWALSLLFQRYLAYLDGMEGRRLAMVFCRPGEGRAPADRSTGASASVLGIGAYNAQWKRVDGHGERTREDWFP